MDKETLYGFAIQSVDDINNRTDAMERVVESLHRVGNGEESDESYAVRIELKSAIERLIAAFERLFTEPDSKYN